MILIKEKGGRIEQCDLSGRWVDILEIEWHETGKRILRKRTKGGEEVVLRFLTEAPALTDGDIIYENARSVIIVEIRPCKTIIVQPGSLYEMALACYEIGNKHLPLFYEAECILMPYDAPVFRMLEAAGFSPRREVRKLLQPLRTSVTPHGHNGGLLTRILEWTNTERND
jgi:urease accessory protein